LINKHFLHCYKQTIHTYIFFVITFIFINTLLSSILILYVNHHYESRAQLIILYKVMFNLCSHLRELWEMIYSYKEITNWWESLIYNKDTLISNVFSFFLLSNLNFKNQQINSRALFWITVCININDKNYFINKITVKEAWNALFLMYKKKLWTTERQYLMKFIEYKMSLNITVNEIWT